MNDYFIRNEREAHFVNLADQLASQFAETAGKYDVEGSFPFEHFEKMKQAGYLKTTVPKKYGGDEASLYEMVLMQERLAKGDGSTALGVGWHVGMILNLRENGEWPEKTYGEFCEKIVNDGEMINSFASERATGSPARGGRPQTTAEKIADGWVITGRKTFSTLSPILNYFTVSAGIKDKDEIGRFLVHKDEHVYIEETWNTMSMRATGSHDVILDGVKVSESALIELEVPGKKTHHQNDQGWMLHIPACYIGIAHAARDYAVKYAMNYRPNSLPGPISELEHIQQKIGQMEIELKTARILLYSVADRWDQNPQERLQLRSELGLAKYIATNSALSIVDQALRIVGGASLSKSLPLERMYRDVRAGIHNPPADDVVIKGMAQSAYNSVK